jgi:peptide/nickel transport system permease protein
MVALIVVAVLVVAAFAGGAVLTRAVGHNGIDPFPYAAPGGQRPVGPLSRVFAISNAPVDDYGAIMTPPRGTPKEMFLLGGDGPLGRDEAIRLLDGTRTSLEVAIFAALLALAVALPLGAAAGYFGGKLDALVSQLTETLMAFPLLFFLVFASAKLASTFRPIGWSWVIPAGVLGEALLIGIFTAFYPLRLIRNDMQRLRTAEFVESADMVGASHRRIIVGHLLPHLVPTILIWAAIAIGTNILLEVGLSFIGLGVQPSTATLGQLLSQTWGTVYAPRDYDNSLYTPWQTIFPTAMILLTVVSLNQIAEGVRRAVGPWSRP